MHTAMKTADTGSRALALPFFSCEVAIEEPRHLQQKLQSRRYPGLGDPEVGL